MHILAVDDEKLALEGVVSSIQAAVPQARVQGFRSGDEAVKTAQSVVPDVAFLDIELRGENGVDIARRLKALNPKINIIFVTGYGHYMKEAFDLYASGYVMKPISEQVVRDQLNNLRFPAREQKRLTVRTFGEFEVLANGVPILFNYGRTLELLAILIDANGSLVSVARLTEMLFEGEDTITHRSYLRNLTTDLRRALKSVDATDVLVRTRGALGIDRNKIACDYFDFLDRKDGALDNFDGEYMNQYSWAESTLGAIESGRV